MTAALVSGMRECKWALPAADYFVDEDDPALTDAPEKSDEELFGRKPAKKTRATNGIPVIGLSVKDANDARSGPLDEATRNKRLGNIEMLKMILIFLRARYENMTKDRAWDVLHDACVRALVTQNWPQDPSRTTPWLYTIARRTHVDDVRRRVRRERFEVLREDCDSNEAVTLPDTTAINLEKMLAYLRKCEPEIAKGVEMRIKVNAGASVPQVAEEYGVSVSTAYEMMKKAGEYVEENWQKLMVAACIALSTLYLLLHPGSEPGGASGGQDVVPDGSVLTPPPHADPSSLRHEGLGFCERKQYEKCLMWLNEARKLDPAGEADPAVSAARKNAEGVVLPKKGAPTLGE